MDSFTYRDGVLCCEDVPLPAIAERFGTPTYVYSRETIVGHLDRFKAAFAELDPLICYSVKSCHNLSILRLVRERGVSFDVVSGGELARVLEAGGDAAGVVFAGVGKRDDELRAAIRAGIGWFNVESESELEQLGRLAEDEGGRVRAALRVNPDVDPHTHQYTTTGKKETKFGVDIERAAAVFRRFGAARRDDRGSDDARRERRGSGSGCVDLSAIHVHIGSPVNTVAPYVHAIRSVLDLIERLRREGFRIDAIDIGGGFGAHYQGSEAPPAAAYAEGIVPLLRGAGLQVIFEPGRSISANAGILLARTVHIKQSGTKRFVIVDAAITELIRPALYGSYHFVWPVEPANGLTPPHRGADLALDGTELVDVVGPVCESGDFLAKDRRLPPVRRGDLLAVFSAGAYGMVMSSQYNSRPRAAEVLVDGADARLIRRRETYDDLVACERV